MRLWAGLLLCVAACGGGDGSSPLAPTPVPTRIVTVTVELMDHLPTFKVDGRLDLALERLPPFAGSVPLAGGVLPAGSRSATFVVEMPRTGGRLRIRERTSNERAPFLCGDAVIDPGGETAVQVALDLCLP